MTRILNRLKVYSLYFWDYLKHGEFTCVLNSFYYMLTRKSNAPGGIVKTGMGTFKTRPKTLDFQYINNAYELSIKEFILKHNFDVFIDAGACIGEYSVWLAKMGKTCFTFEPITYSYDVINENIKLNNVEETVKVFNYGLGKQHEVDYFIINKTNFGASKKVNQQVEGAERFEINAIDDVFESFNIPVNSNILFKIDVEGMELELFQGAKNFIKKYPNILFIIEEKHTGEQNIKELLNTYSIFEYGTVDEYNFYARKC
ncbi:MAG: FkbM family methyltransferase [Bacteroidia bacterium]